MFDKDQHEAVLRTALETAAHVAVAGGTENECTRAATAVVAAAKAAQKKIHEADE